MPNWCKVRVKEGFTRRAWLACAAGVPAFAQGDNDPLRLLKSGHPRLILPDSELERLRSSLRENALARRLLLDLEKECDGLLSIPPIEYKLTGPRLQAQTRRALD